MSAQAPTTPKLDSLPPEIEARMLYELFEPKDLSNFAKVCGKRQRGVQKFYESKYSSTVLAAFGSQSSQAEKKGRMTLDLSKRSLSLVHKTDQLVGGRFVLNSATQNKGVSVRHHDVQQKLAKKFWNTKTVGLVALLKVVPEAKDLLKTIKSIKSIEEKYLAMEVWLKSHTPNLTHACVVRIKERDVIEYVIPSFMFLPGGKALNCIPSALKYFKNLTKLELQNNLLNSLPGCVSGLGLKELHLFHNFFKKMPPVIPTLEKLSLERNGTFLFDDIASYIRMYIEAGGKGLTITMDKCYASEKRFESLIKEIESEETHDLSVSNQNDLCVIEIFETIPVTQPLSI